MVDYDVMIRDRAYEIWEKAGRPMGLEHEHWARARYEIESEIADAEPAASVAASGPTSSAEPLSPEPIEAARLRQALYCPEPFSFELFGEDCPSIDLPIVLKQDAGADHFAVTAKAA